MSQISGFTPRQLTPKFGKAERPLSFHGMSPGTGTPVSNELTFSGNISGGVKTWVPLAMVLASMAGIFGPGVATVARAQTGEPDTTTLYSDVLPNGEPVGPICKPSDMPHINAAVDQDIIDTFHNPL